MPTVRELRTLRKQLKSLNTGYAGVLAERCKVSEAYVGMVLAGSRRSELILTTAVDLLEELRAKQASLTARIKRATTKQAA